jgi:ribosomal protein L34E
VARAVAQMREEGLESDWEAHLSSRSPVVYETKKTGYLERRVSKAVARCAEILHSIIGVERKPPLEPTLVQPHKAVWRIYGSELSENHATALESAAASGETIKFKGQAHRVSLCQTKTLAPTPFNQVFDLHKVKK